MVIERFFAGSLAKLVEDKTYDLTYRQGIISGQMYFSFDDKIKRQKLEGILSYYLKHPKLSELRIKPGDLKTHLMVIAVSDDHKTAIRGQLGPVLDKMKVPVMDVDGARVLIFSHKNLYYISKQHLEEPFLAFECVLEGIEFFRSSAFYGRALKLNYEVLVGKKLQGTCTGFWQCDYSKAIPMLRIRDVDMGLDFNSVMQKSIYQLLPGDFPTVQNVQMSCYVVHGEPAGEFYLQMDSSYITDLEAVLRKFPLQRVLTLSDGYSAGQLSKDAVYVAPQSIEDTNTLYRAKFLGLVPPSTGDKDVVKVRLFYMDYGNEGTVPIDQIRSASVIDRHLERIPALCYKVYLKWVRSLNDYDKLMEFVGTNMYQVEIRSGTREGSPIAILTGNSEDGNTFVLNKRLVAKGIVMATDKVKFRPK